MSIDSKEALDVPDLDAGGRRAPDDSVTCCGSKETRYRNWYSGNKQRLPGDLACSASSDRARPISCSCRSIRAHRRLEPTVGRRRRFELTVTSNADVRHSRTSNYVQNAYCTYDTLRFVWQYYEYRVHYPVRTICMHGPASHGQTFRPVA